MSHREMPDFRTPEEKMVSELASMISEKWGASSRGKGNQLTVEVPGGPFIISVSKVRPPVYRTDR